MFRSLFVLSLGVMASATESKPASECITDYALENNKGCNALSAFGQCVALAPIADP